MNTTTWMMLLTKRKLATALMLSKLCQGQVRASQVPKHLGQLPVAVRNTYVTLSNDNAHGEELLSISVCAPNICSAV